MPNPQDKPAFARGMAGPNGKYSEEVKVHLDEPTHAQWLQLCNANDVTSSELLRDLIYLVVHGKTPAEVAANNRRGLFSSIGTVAGLNRAGRHE